MYFLSSLSYNYIFQYLNNYYIGDEDCGSQMATAKFGQLEAFDPDSDTVTVYIECVHLFFAAHNIPDKKAVPVFLSTIGGKTYELHRNLVYPDSPETLKLTELTDVLKCHYEPKPLIAERFHFH